MSATTGALTIDAKRVGWWSTPPERLRGLHALLGGPPREPGAPITRRDVDLARSVQELAEETVMRMADHAHQLTGETRLCLAGGVALNCVANGRLLREGPFDEVWVQPAAGDSGSAARRRPLVLAHRAREPTGSAGRIRWARSNAWRVPGTLVHH